MKELNWFSALTATLGGWLGWLFGGLDGFLTVLIIFVILDYVSGILRAGVERKLSSVIGFRGLARKMAMFVMVIIGHLVDDMLIGYGGILRTAVIFFYCANEALSILENVTSIGLPIPKKLKDILLQLRKKNDTNGGNDDEKSAD